MSTTQIKTQESLTPFGYFANAAGSALAMDAVIHPLGTWRNHRLSDNKGWLSVRTLYTAWGANVAGTIPSVTVASFAHEMFLGFAKDKKKPTDREEFVASLAAAAFSTPTATFFEGYVLRRQVLKMTRAQIFSYYVKMGPTSLFKGLVPVGLREVFFTTSVFSGYKKVKESLPEYLSYPVARTAVAGFATGAACGALTLPFDLVRVKMQEDLYGSSKVMEKTMTVFKNATVKDLAQKCGVRSVFLSVAFASLGVCREVFPGTLFYNDFFHQKN